MEQEKLPRHMMVRRCAQMKLNEKFDFLRDRKYWVGALDHSPLCFDCSYANHGFVCWSGSGGCLRAWMMVMDGRVEQIDKLWRINRINSRLMPFQVCDIGHGCYAMGFRLAYLDHRTQARCQRAFDQFAEDHLEPVIRNGMHTHGKPCEWNEVFQLVCQDIPGHTFVQVETVADGFNCYSFNLEVMERMAEEFLEQCGSSGRFQRLVNQALGSLPQYGGWEES